MADDPATWRSMCVGFVWFCHKETHGQGFDVDEAFWGAPWIEQYSGKINQFVFTGFEL